MTEKKKIVLLHTLRDLNNLSKGNLLNQFTRKLNSCVKSPLTLGCKQISVLPVFFSNVENVVNLDAGVKGGFTLSVF